MPVAKKTVTKKTVTKKAAPKKAVSKKTPSKAKAADKKVKAKNVIVEKTPSKAKATDKKVKAKNVVAKKTPSKAKAAVKKTPSKAKAAAKKKVKAKNVVKVKKDNKKNIANMTFYFPKTKNANKLKLTEQGRYFITKPEDAEAISKIITEYVKTPKTKTITDATAGMGGNTINFASHFKKVQAVEVDKENFEVLKNNVDVFGLKNVDLINKDYLTEAKNLKQDVIFIDAPWGGKKKHKFIRLQLGEKFLPDLLNELKGKADFMVFRAPGNFDYGYMMRKIEYPHVDVRFVPNRNWKVIVVYN